MSTSCVDNGMYLEGKRQLSATPNEQVCGFRWRHYPTISKI